MADEVKRYTWAERANILARTYQAWRYLANAMNTLDVYKCDYILRRHGLQIAVDEESLMNDVEPFVALIPCDDPEKSVTEKYSLLAVIELCKRLENATPAEIAKIRAEGENV